MQIYDAIPKIMAEIGAIGKNQKNVQQGFMYRGIDSVMNALQPLLYKHGVFVVPEVLEHKREDRITAKGNGLIYSVCTIRYTFYATDGSSVSAVVVGEGMDSGDKATNKAMAIAFKYACFQVFCIPTEEMKDPDAETPPPSEPLMLCADCGIEMPQYEDESGKPINKQRWAKGSEKKFGRILCKACISKETDSARPN